MSNLSSLLFKLHKPFGIIFDLSISNLSTSDYKRAKSVFSSKSHASKPVARFKPAFVA